TVDLTVVSGSPVRFGDMVGVALTSAEIGPGNKTAVPYATVAFQGEWKVAVAGTLALGAKVFTAQAPTAGKAVLAPITTVEGTTSKKFFGFITGILPGSGSALVTIAGQTPATGASA